MTDEPSLDDFAFELLRRRQARENFSDFMKYLHGLPPPKHMKFLCDKLQDKMSRKGDRLLVCFPPGHGKSTVSSLYYPAFYLSKNPTHNIITVSHTESFAEQWGRKVRNLMMSDEYKFLFPEIKVAEDSRSAGRWDLVNGGSYYATGVGGTVTGRRADCLAGDTILQTPNGTIRIEDIDVCPSPCYVLSYDTERTTDSSPTYRRVIAVARRKTSERFRVHTSNGSVLEATGNHLVFNQRGFVKVETLCVGDLLLRSVPNTEVHNDGRGGEKDKERQNGILLQFPMFNSGEQRSAWNGFSKNVQRLWGTVGTKIKDWGFKKNLLGKMSVKNIKRSRGKAQNTWRLAQSYLRDLSKAVYGIDKSINWKILFQNLLKHRPQRKNVWEKQSRLSSWWRDKGRSLHTLFSCGGENTEGLDGFALAYNTAGRKGLRGLQESAQTPTSLPSYKFESERQQTRKLGGSLPPVPYETSCSGAFKTESDTVSLVERVCEEIFVYDIEVEDTHCFFANGILVHNCVICDDLLKGVDDAESKLVRDNMWDWWGSDLSTRLKPSGVMVIIGTRWHLDDIIGRVMAAEKQKGGDKWDKVILPALAKDKDPLGRKEGEALWPEWESEVALARRRNQPSMTSRQWESLYQQSPVLDSGNVIKRDWIKIWNQREPPKCDFILQSWDTAITSKNKSAFSVCLTFGIFTEDKTDLPSIILLSRWRGRVDYPELRKMAQRLANNYLDDNLEVPMTGNFKKPPDMILIEAKATGEPLIADLNRAGISATRFNPNKHGDKNARLLLTTDIFENGRFYVPGQPPNYTLPRRWAEGYVNSLISFPASDSRDDADATSQAIIRMKTSGWIKNSLDAIEEVPFRVTKRANGALYG